MTLLVLATGWVLVRWHHQCLMLERLMWLQEFHDRITTSPEVARIDVEGAIMGQYEQLEYYLRHPAKLDPTMPDSLVDEEYAIAPWQSIRASAWLPTLQAQHQAFCAQIGVTNDTQQLRREEDAWRRAKIEQEGTQHRRAR